MGLADNLRQASTYLRKLRLSRGPDSYFQYKRQRNQERTEADHARERARDTAERQRREAARERRHEERYAQEREGDLAREQSEPGEGDRPGG